MKPWWQVVTPHKDIREGHFDEAVFAAKLGDVIKRSGPADYLDPAIFLSKTYLTAGLKNLIKNVILRLSNKSTTDSVIQLQTPFGGGKTHALIALYHILKNGEKINHLSVKYILKECKLKQTPKTKLAIFVGTEENAISGRTPWGEIAHQLGSYSLLEKHDKKKISPGKEILRQLLEKNAPVLILIDELLEYLVKASGQKVGEGTLKGQVIAFFQELTETVSTLDNCVLVVTLPSSTPERFDEAGEAAFLQLQKIFGRVERLYELVEGEEYYEIIRKRLFENIGDEQIRDIVAQKYFELYKDLGDDIASFSREINYREKIKKSYPFHPEIIDILFERWGTIQSFQRTRGVLRLLALIVSDLYSKQDSSLLIHPSRIDFSNSNIRGEFVKHIGNVFEGVISSDITNKANQIDREMGSEYQKFKVASSISTCIFFYSFSGTQEKKGVGLPQLRVSFLQEGIPPAIVGDAIKRLEDELWYLYNEGSLYYFSNNLNLNRMILDKEETISEENIKEEIRKLVEKFAGKEFNIYLWPESTSDIPDNTILKLVILSPVYPVKSDRTKEFINEIMTKYSSGFRVWKNTLIFLVIDETESSSIKEQVKRLLALKSIKDAKTEFKKLSEENRHSLEEKIRKTETTIPFRLFSGYRYIVKGTVTDEKDYRNLGIPTVGETQSLSKRVKDYLKEEGLILDKIHPPYLIKNTFSLTDKEKSYGEIKEAIAKYTTLPMIEHENVLESAICEGVQQGSFGIMIGDKVYFEEQILESLIGNETIILQKEIAKTEKEKAAKVTEKTPAELEPQPVAPQPTEIISSPAPAKITKKLKIRAKVPWDKLSALPLGVIAPLQRDGAMITLEIEISAESEKGISKDTIQLKIKETLNQINAEIKEFKEEN